MGLTLAIGTTAKIAKTYDTAINFTAISNATEAVLTVAASPIVAGDIVEITSGWSRLDGRIVRVKTGTATSMTLEGIDTADTAKYSTGSGLGSVRKVSAWTELPQTTRISVSGGEQQYASATRLMDAVERQIPTRRSPITIALETFEEPAATWYADTVKADAAGVPWGLMLTFPNGSKLLSNGFVTLPKIPQISGDDVLSVTINVALAAEPARYAS